MEQSKKPASKGVKVVIVVLIIGVVFLVISHNNQNPKSRGKGIYSTNFATKDELYNHIRGSVYSSLKSEWGDGIVGEPWDVSAVGEMKMEVSVIWENVKCEGKPIQVTFKNDFDNIGDAFKKNPGAFTSYNIKSEGRFVN